MEDENIRKLPIILRTSAERLAAVLLIACFFGLVLLLLGAAAGEWGVCAAGGAIPALAFLWARYEKGCEVAFEADRVTVRSPFSQKSYPYEGMDFLLRRSWTVTARRSGTGLAGTAIQLRRGGRVELAVSVSKWGGRDIREAIAFLEGLPNLKRYL